LGEYFLWLVFLENTIVFQISATFSTVKVMYVIILAKNGLGHILGDSLTNASGHPDFGTSVRCAYHLIYFAFVEEKYFFIIERVVYIHTRTARIDLILAVGTSVRGFLTSFPPQWGGFISFFTLLLQLQITNLFHVLRSLTDGKF
jgi:hypothetical protein